MIKTVLVPTDGSDHANKAVGLASDLALKYEARMVVLHVISAKHLPEGVLRAYSKYLKGVFVGCFLGFAR